MPAYSVRKALLPLARKIVLALQDEPTLDENRIRIVRNRLTEQAKKAHVPKNLELVHAYRALVKAKKISPNPRLLEAIQKRRVRTLSGIANITVLTAAMGCPGQCIFCPTERGMPKSYLSNEPAMMRAVQNQFDPYRQVKARLKGLVAQGHDVSKVDIRIAGGTWGAYPKDYQTEFMMGIFRALNEGAEQDSGVRNQKSAGLEDLIEQNETAACRCVGLWIETRPDWVDEAEIIRLRRFNVTGVELGIQTTDDKVNEFCRRGHGLKESIHATQLLRDAGLKVCHHLMPNLPTATLKSDLKSGRDLFDNEGLRPDYLKIYPMVVTASAPLAKMLDKNPLLHKPYTEKQLVTLIKGIKKHIPEYCRVIRVIRDIPEESVLMGNKKTNLRQLIQNAGVECRCIRCREIQNASFRTQDTELRTQRYKANGGTEVFITIEEPRLDKIIALCRLRLPDPKRNPVFRALKGAALIRELHVYGRQHGLGEATDSTSKTQHLGFGRKLMVEAECIARKAGYSKIAVIAAVGTREYYRKLGYKLEETYMTKKLK